MLDASDPSVQADFAFRSDRIAFGQQAQKVDRCVVTEAVVVVEQLTIGEAANQRAVIVEKRVRSTEARDADHEEEQLFGHLAEESRANLGESFSFGSTGKPIHILVVRAE